MGGIETSCRARLVARQVKEKGVERISALTPPLEATRSVVSMAAAGIPGQWSVDWGLVWVFRNVRMVLKAVHSG